jgi:hypothetical protein
MRRMNPTDDQPTLEFERPEVPREEPPPEPPGVWDLIGLVIILLGGLALLAGAILLIIWYWPIIVGLLFLVAVLTIFGPITRNMDDTPSEVRKLRREMRRYYGD